MSKKSKEFNKKSHPLKEFYAILGAEPPKLSKEEKKDLKKILKGLKKLRERDPEFKEAIKAFVDTEAKYGKDDPAEGKIVIAPKPPKHS
jgi:hypothetical protein